MPFSPQNFAFTEEDLAAPGAKEIVSNPLVGVAVPTAKPAGKIDVGEASAQLLEQASDQEIAEAQELSQSPAAVAKVLRQSQEDAARGDGQWNLSNSEKLVLGVMALAPILGGILGKEEGALAGAAAAGQGLQAYGAAQERAGVQAGKAAIQRQKMEGEKQKRQDSLDKEQRQVVKEMRDDFAKNRVKVEFDKTIQASTRLNSILARGRTGVADTAAVMAFLKSMDPASVASPGEQQAVKEAQSYQDQIDALINKFGAEGKFLSAEAKADMQNIMQGIEGFYRKSLDAEIRRVREGAEIYGVSPDLVVPEDYTLRYMGALGTDKDDAVKADREKKDPSEAKPPRRGIIESIGKKIESITEPAPTRPAEAKQGEIVIVPGIGRMIKEKNGKLRLAPK